jgi:disulfide bond formation protein DsbB
MIVLGVDIRIPFLLIAVIFLALFVIEYRKPEHTNRKRNLWIYGLIGGLSAAMVVYHHFFASEHPFETCTYTEATQEECTAPQYPALVLFKSDNCIFCKHFSCTWENAVAKIKAANLPVNTYAVDTSKLHDCTFLDVDKIEKVPTVRYYYDEKKYDDFQGERTSENFENFIKTKITDHISPAGATTPKPTGETERYTYLSGRDRYAGVKSINEAYA